MTAAEPLSLLTPYLTEQGAIRMVADPGTCKGCGAKILWVRSALTQKPVPLDFVPQATGEFVLTPLGTAVKIGKHDRPAVDELRYVNHFATCPAAEQFRRPR
jgi:hypothetical protein